MPIPRLHDVTSRTTFATLPLIQVVTRHGIAGIYEKTSRERVDVMSAMMISTRSAAVVSPTWYMAVPAA